MKRTKPFEGKKVNVNITMAPELRKRGDTLAEELKMKSLSELLGWLLERELSKESPPALSTLEARLAALESQLLSPQPQAEDVRQAA